MAVRKKQQQRQRSNATYDRDFGEEFQMHMLAVLLRTPGVVQRYRTAIDPLYFSTDPLRVVADSLITHVDGYHGLPTRVTLLEGVRERVGEQAFPTVERVVKRLYKREIPDADSVVDRIVDFGKTQAMVNAVLRSVDEIERGALHKVRPLIQDASMVGADLGDKGIEYGSDDAYRRGVYAVVDDPNNSVPTGISHLDDVLGGGLRRGELGAVLALPKVGKSTALVNIGFGAVTSAEGFGAVHYTCEMSREMVFQRYDDRLAGPNVKWRNEDRERYMKILETRAKKFVRGRLLIQGYPSRHLTTSTIRAHLTTLASDGFTPDVLLVDYADIMRPERRLGEVRHEQAGIYEDLREIAGEFNVAVWTGSQAPPGSCADKETLTIYDFAESREKGMILDCAVSINQTRDEALDGRVRLFVAGLRRGEGEQVIECDIVRKQCSIRSTGLRRYRRAGSGAGRGGGSTRGPKRRVGIGKRIDRAE